MWSSLGVLALLSALNPVRLGLVLLVVSRPRPVQNLLAFWVGCTTGCLPFLVVPLALMNFTPVSNSFAQDSTPSSTVRNIQIGAGVVALCIAALITARSLNRRRQRTKVRTGNAKGGRHREGGTTSTQVLDSNTPTAISRLLSRAQDAPTEGGSAFLRLLRRLHKGWENGSLWVAFVLGLGFGGPNPDAALFAVAIIVTSGAAIGTQVIAVIAFAAGMLALLEIVLVGYLAAPTKTQKVLGALHDWSWTHRRKILVAVLAVAGVALVTQSVSI